MEMKIIRWSSLNYIAVYTNGAFIVTGVGITVAEATTDALLEYEKAMDKLGGK